MFKKQCEFLGLEESVSVPIDPKEPKSTAEQEDNSKLCTTPVEKIVVLEPVSNVFSDISEYSRILRALFGLSRPSVLDSICKLINKENFWFFVNSLYFPTLEPYHIEQVQQFRSQPPEPRIHLMGSSLPPALTPAYSLDDDLFRLANRALAQQHLPLCPAPTIPLDDLISLWQSQLSSLHDRNDTLLHNLPHSTPPTQIAKLISPLPYHSEYVTFETIELEEQEMARSKERHQKLAKRENVCEMCLGKQNTKNNPLVFCRECAVGVHKKCYPLEVGGEGEFVCFCCERGMAQGDEKCVGCECVGGLMLPVQMPQGKSNNDQPKLKRLFTYAVSPTPSPTHIKLLRSPTHPHLIHASCFRWHSTLFFDEQLNLISGMSTLKPPKPQSFCQICTTQSGYLVQCQYHGCQKSFHPECARRFGVTMNTVKQSTKLIREIFCDRHREKRMYQTMEENRWGRVVALRRVFEAVEKIAGIGKNGSTEKKEKSKKRGDQQRSERKSRCLSVRAQEISEMPECSNCMESLAQSMNVIDNSHLLCDKCL